MENFILFFNSFMSYLLLVLAIVGAAAFAFVLGRILKKIIKPSAAKEKEEI